MLSRRYPGDLGCKQLNLNVRDVIKNFILYFLQIASLYSHTDQIYHPRLNFTSQCLCPARRENDCIRYYVTGSGTKGWNFERDEKEEKNQAAWSQVHRSLGHCAVAVKPTRPSGSPRCTKIWPTVKYNIIQNTNNPYYVIEKSARGRHHT